MVIHIHEGLCFAEVSDKYLLLICTEEELKKASQQEIRDMVKNAIDTKGD